MLELWLSLSLPAGARPGGQGGSSVSLLDPAVAVSGRRRLTSSSAGARVSLTVTSDLSSLASCALSHDCLVCSGGGALRDGRDPMVGKGMWWWCCAPGAPSSGVPVFCLVELANMRFNSGFNVIIEAQTMAVLISIRDQ